MSNLHNLDRDNSYQYRWYAQYDPTKVDLSIVALKSLGLGILILVNFTMMVLSACNIINSSPAITRINGYLIFVLVFYLLEFFSTCLFNNSETDDDSFILNDIDLHIVHVVSILEILGKTWLFPSFIIDFPIIGLCVVFLGQFSRTLAMYTAKESFNHYIQREHMNKHKLVTWGIYRYLRHPSYFGFFWWFIGTQLWLGNLAVLALGIFKLWNFFNYRIKFEEKFLINFFGQDYTDYKSKARTGIPFIE